MKRLKTAVIGVGNMGKNHVRIYDEISDLVAVADVNSQMGEQIADEFGVNFYPDYITLLEKEKPDAVSVVVPTKYHYAVAGECLKRKVPTLVEKPVAETVYQAQQLLQIAKAHKTFLMVGHVERFNPAVKKLKELVEEGKLGSLVSLVALRLGIAPPRTRYSDVVLDLAVHDIDVFSYLLDEEPRRRTIARSRLYQDSKTDSASMLIEYSSATGLIQTNWITPIKMRKLYVTGTDGFVELDYIRQKIEVFDKVVVKKPIGSFYEFVSLVETPKKTVKAMKREPLKEELLYFLDHVNSSDYSIATSGIAALRLVKGV